MSKLILCSGVRVQRPYCFNASGIRIYSIEELCYYLYNHIYLVDEIILNEELFDWIGTELKLEQRANKLKQLKKQKADLKTIITAILCSADYYTESEIKGILKQLDDILRMPLIKRRCLKAAGLLKNKNYREAAKEYENIIHSKEAVDLTPEDYGDLYHNLGVAKVRINGLLEASQLFIEAYERNHREESLRQYLYTLLLMNNHSEYYKKIEHLQISDSIHESINDFIRQNEEEAEMSASYNVIEQLKEQKENGNLSSFFIEANKLINRMKEEYSKT